MMPSPWLCFPTSMMAFVSPEMPPQTKLGAETSLTSGVGCVLRLCVLACACVVVTTSQPVMIAPCFELMVEELESLLSFNMRHHLLSVKLHQ